MKVTYCDPYAVTEENPEGICKVTYFGTEVKGGPKLVVEQQHTDTDGVVGWAPNHGSRMPVELTMAETARALAMRIATASVDGEGEEAIVTVDARKMKFDLDR